MTLSHFLDSFIVLSSGSDGDDDAVLGLFLGGLRDDDAAGRLALALLNLDQDTIAEGFYLHTIPPEK